MTHPKRRPSLATRIFGLWLDVAATGSALAFLHGVDMLSHAAAWILAGLVGFSACWLLARKADA